MYDRELASAAQLTGIYVTVTTFWLVFSDRLADRLATTLDGLTAIQTLKGVAYTFVTAGVTFAVVRRRDLARVRLERELRSARDAIEQHEELRSSFLTALSHEMRTPLTTVIGVASILESRQGQLFPDQTRDLVDRLIRAARRLDRFLVSIERVYQVASDMRAITRQETDLSSIACTVVDRFPANHRISVDPSRAIAYVDPQLVELLLEHLVGNVHKHTPDGTRASIRIRLSSRGVTIDVEDNGPGIPEDQQRIIFEPFKQHAGPDHAPGIGIGLAAVDRIAAMHGGLAWVESQPGGGACFRVFFPQRARPTSRWFSLTQRTKAVPAMHEEP